jgi:hypothetical protein
MHSLKASSRYSKDFRFSMNPKAHHQVHNSLPLVSALSQINPIKTHYIFLLSDPWSPKWSLSFRFAD